MFKDIKKFGKCSTIDIFDGSNKDFLHYEIIDYLKFI